jgi:hypothetical protein
LFCHHSALRNQHENRRGDGRRDGRGEEEKGGVSINRVGRIDRVISVMIPAVVPAAMQ